MIIRNRWWGASGEVAFTEAGTRVPSYLVVNARKEGYVPIGVITGPNQTLQFLPGQAAIWRSGKTDIPPDEGSQWCCCCLITGLNPRVPPAQLRLLLTRTRRGCC